MRLIVRHLRIADPVSYVIGISDITNIKRGWRPLCAYIQALVHLGLHYRQPRPEGASGETVIQELLYEQHTQSIVLDVDVKHNLRSLANKSYHIMPSVP